jgi:hypothetical protein
MRWRRPSRGCGRCRSLRAHSHSARSPASRFARHADLTLPANGQECSDSKATDRERSAERAPWSPLGIVTYLKPADHTLRGENGGSRLEILEMRHT